MTDYEAVHFMNAQHVHGAAEKKLHLYTHSYTGHAANVGFTVSENNKSSTYVRNVHTRQTKSNQNLNTDILLKIMAMSDIIIPVPDICLLTQFC